MRVKLFVVSASLSGLLGCAGAGSHAGPGAYSIGQQSAPPAAQYAVGSRYSAPAPGTAGPIQQVSWTERVTSVLTQNPLTTLGLASTTPKPPADSLSLDHRTGEPTPDLLVSMAAISAKAGGADQARQLYQRVIAQQPGHVEALLGLARLEDREGNLPAALAVYQQAAANNPDNATVLNDLALCHARQGDLTQSLLALHQATKIDPQRPLYRNNIAKVLVEMNRLNDALAELSVVHEPATAHYNLSVLLNQRGRQTEAIQYAELALRLNPDHQPAQGLLAQLRPAGRSATTTPAPVSVATNYFQQRQTPAGTAGVGGAAPQPQVWQFPGKDSPTPAGRGPMVLPPVKH